jgi:hypothetical protein
MSEDPQAFLTHLLPVLEKIARVRLAQSLIRTKLRKQPHAK